MFRLDYLSCLLTVLSTAFVARKQWYGLLIGALNCVIISVIGYQTHQYGFIAANAFCMVAYLASVRSWRNLKPSESPVPAAPPAEVRPGRPFLVPKPTALATGTDPVPPRG